ncbi:MAG: hypothetical protein JST47_12550 [Bacteroidetes bacterium]|nr:hypothetical protein [Bacteroidota bacterium]MBS1974386.1 hypothetical protein [Bacteroidota bacterium]
MKKLLIVMISLALAGTVSAQRIGHSGGGGGVYYHAPRVIVSGGLYPYYGFGFGFNPFFPYYYPYGPYGYYHRPSKLDLQVLDIKNDYNDKIWSAKHDTSLSRKERREKVHELKVQRDREINDLKMNYYKQN